MTIIVIVLTMLGALIAGWFSAISQPVNLLGGLVLLFFWFGLLFVPGVIGLLRRGVQAPAAR